jgi:hypothetical protein
MAKAAKRVARAGLREIIALDLPLSPEPTGDPLRDAMRALHEPSTGAKAKAELIIGPAKNRFRQLLYEHKLRAVYFSASGEKQSKQSFGQLRAWTA